MIQTGKLCDPRPSQKRSTDTRPHSHHGLFDLDEFFSRTMASHYSDVRFRRAKMCGEQLNETGIGLAVLCRGTNRHDEFALRFFRDGFHLGKRLDHYPKLSRHD
jgi:hypothetical protein